MPADVPGLSRGPHAAQRWGPDRTLWLLCEIRMLRSVLSSQNNAVFTISGHSISTVGILESYGPFCVDSVGEKQEVVCFHPEE